MQRPCSISGAPKRVQLLATVLSALACDRRIQLVEFLCKGQLSEKEIAATLQTTQAAEGHPSEVMDMSFANQFMSQLRLAELYKKGKRLENKVYDISAEQDQEIGTVKLGTMDIWIDKLTPEQVKYQSDYSAGT